MDRIERDIYDVAGMEVKRPTRLSMRQAAISLGDERQGLLARRKELSRELTASTLDARLKRRTTTPKLRQIEKELEDLRIRFADVDLAWKRAERLAALAAA